MKTRIMAALFALLAPLGACQTIEQAGESEAATVCTQNGYGPGTKYYDYCVQQLKPAAVTMERRHRAELFSQGIAQIGRGLNPPSQQPRLTCVQTGNVSRCY